MEILKPQGFKAQAAAEGQPSMVLVLSPAPANLTLSELDERQPSQTWPKLYKYIWLKTERDYSEILERMRRRDEELAAVRKAQSKSKELAEEPEQEEREDWIDRANERNPNLDL